jgi:hypothetical protein
MALSRADMQLSNAEMDLSNAEVSVSKSEAMLANITFALLMLPLGAMQRLLAFGRFAHDSQCVLAAIYRFADVITELLTNFFYRRSHTPRAEFPSFLTIRSLRFGMSPVYCRMPVQMKRHQYPKMR